MNAAQNSFFIVKPSFPLKHGYSKSDFNFKVYIEVNPNTYTNQ